MTILQAIVAIVVALITGTTGGGLVFAKFLIERKDKLESETIQKRIDEAVGVSKKEMHDELEKMALKKSNEGRERFNAHAVSIEEINKQIRANNEQISELTTLTKKQMEKMESVTDLISSLTKIVKLSADSQKSYNCDRILAIANKALKDRKITITDRTYLEQQYNSWVGLHEEGEKLDLKIVTMYEECMKIVPVPDD